MPEDEETRDRVLAQMRAHVREALRADRSRKGGRWLALVPMAAALLVMLLAMPRATAPDAVPLPCADHRVLQAIERADDARAQAAEAKRLPSDVLAVGSAIRVLGGAEARGADEATVADHRRALDASLRDLGRREGILEDLFALRALQTRRFLDALAQWEAGGEASEDFTDLASTFVTRAADAGWVEGRRVILGESERRVMFKTVWNALAGVESERAFALTVDEQRALYTFYFLHPRVPESRRFMLEAEARAATTPELCARAKADHRRQAELWRAEKIRHFGTLDPSYPTEYALGVAYYRLGRYDESASAFASFARRHPDGPYALRAKHHLKSALAGGER